MPEPASFLISIRELEKSLVLPSSARLPLASKPLIEFLAKLGEPLTLTREREQSIDAILNEGAYHLCASASGFTEE